MLRDVFYYGNKPNVHPREKFATSIEDARSQCTTEHFWIINEFCDYRNFDWDFDFEFLPDEDVWAEEHNNVWPSQHQKDSGTWLCPLKLSEVIIYRNDVDPVRRKNIKNKFWLSTEFVDNNKFDYSWHPDPTEPNFIYEFGTQWHDRGGPRYVPDSITRLSSGEPIGQIKHMSDLMATLVENKTNWEIPSNIDISSFDFSWVPHPDESPYIYQFGTQHQKTGGPKYIIEGATDVKYVNIQKAKALPDQSKWTIPDNIDATTFDFSWHPDATSPPYIYRFPTQWAMSGGPTYAVEGATEVKYVDVLTAKAIVDKTNWSVPSTIDSDSFDFSWHPYVEDEPYIYQFGTQWQKTGGPKYITPGTHANSPVKYIDTRIIKAKRLAVKEAFNVLDENVIDNFDYSWHPDETEEPYIYQFGNNQYPAEIMPTLEYVVPGATQIKYISDIVATLGENKNRWEIPNSIDTSEFDFSWVPNPKDPEYVYQFGTQWQKTGGPRYVMSNATEVKYIDLQKVKALANSSNWTIPSNIDSDSFDYSWHPDDTSPPYIYRFPTQWAMSGGPTYTVHGATEVKYVDVLTAKAIVDKTNWIIPPTIDSDSFDFSWHPYVEDEPYIYQFGTQWQKTGGPLYVTPGTHANSPVKYIDTRIIKAKRLPVKEAFTILDDNVINDFDYSWHSDDTDEPYIYLFGNNQYPAEIMPTIEYVVDGATQIKYVSDIIATLGENKNNWIIPSNIDSSEFDFSWKPNPKDPEYIYEFGTQWQKTGGPRYVMPNATEVKYIDLQKVKALPSKDEWSIPDNIDATTFDFSWHPDATSPPYIYRFPTQWAMSGGPTYTVPDATEVKYVDALTAKALPNKNNWVIPSDIDSDSFDFSWHPYVEDEPYIYYFGTQWQKTGGPKYITPGTHANSPVKYIDTRIIKSKRLPDKSKFTIVDNNVVAEFDYSWHPDSTEEPYIYVFGNNQYPAEIMPTIEYVVNGATQIKYINDIVATLGANKNNWDVPKHIDVTDFDFSWVPNPKDPEYIYEFGTQWQKTGGPKYVVEGASEIKYVEGSKAKTTLVDMSVWTIPENISFDKFDFTWHPDATSPPYIYNFATQWALSGGPIYAVPLALEHKYIDDQIAIALPNKENWEYNDNEIDAASFDFSWHPYIEDQPYVYQFGTQHQKTGGPKYLTPGVHKNSPVKYIDTRIIKAKRLPNKQNWIVPDDIETSSFDFSWHTDDTETDPYIYIFGTQHQKTGGPQYVTSGVPRLASGKPIGQIKYVDTIKAKKLPNKKHWTNPNDSDVTTFDFSWHPDDTSPPTTYQFGTLLDKEDGPRYVHPSTMDDVVVYLERIEKQVETNTVEVFPKYIITTTLEELIKQHPNELFWALNPDLDYSEFDFNWRPSIEQAQYVHAFGSSESEKTQTYLVNSSMWEKGFRELNWVVDKKLDDETLFKMFKKSDMFFVDRSNNESQARFEKLKLKFPTIQKTRYLNSWVDTINRCINRSTTELCWILNSELDYSEFNFEYYPNPWQMKMVQVFGTQWSHWGTTFMVNRETFAQDTKYIKIIEHLSNLNFVKDRKAKATNVLYDIVYIDHGNMDMTPLKQEGRTVIKYQNSYITTFQKMLDVLPVKKEHYVWIASTVCDYKDFDFTYICDPFAKEQLHVFPSDRQKFGDTFLVDVNKLRSLIEDMNVLEDYEKINYNQSQRVKRLPAPIIFTEGDTHVSTIDSDFNFPYATFVTADNKEIQVVDSEPMSLWTPESKNIQITSAGGTRIVVPKEAKEYVKRELYDYPYITTNSRLAKSSPMDIVFLSNGETGAEENYQHLLKVTEGLPNRVTRVDGVNGRVAAYHAAAEASNTPWMFTVFAKLTVSNKFDWNWQPDRLQLPKHYVFHARNPVNGLKYGHMAMIAYNKKLTLANQGKGLDFTMDDEHEVVEINSGIANFNTDEWSTWRTSFREALKLRAENSEVSNNRLEMWLTVGMGKFSQYSIEGAQHAVEYYNEVNGDFDKLRLSYDWPWLKTYYETKYKL